MGEMGNIIFKLVAGEKYSLSIQSHLKDKKINNVVFNRGGYRYHGRIKVVAETLRENGIIL